jgi:ribosomal 30S subunit maturation factor RimM
MLQIQSKAVDDDIVEIARIGRKLKFKNRLAFKLFFFSPKKNQEISLINELFIKKQLQWLKLPREIFYISSHFIELRDYLDDSNIALLIGVNDMLGIKRNTLPDTEEDEYYVIDILGKIVYNNEGISMGIVHRVISFKGNNILDCGKYYVPFSKKHVLHVNYDSIIVDWHEDDII